MNLIFAIVTAIQFGKTNDSEVILFWSGIYILIGWAIFIWLPMKLSKRLKFGKLVSFASPIMGIYSAFVYTILIGKTFDFSETYFLFLPFAIITGLIYGLLLTILRFNGKAEKYLLYLIPTIGIAFYFLFPKLLPSQAFRFMPDKIQSEIVSRIIPQLKVGDPYKNYLEKLPYAFKPAEGLSIDHVCATRENVIPEDYSSSMSATNEFISFEMTVENGIITELNYELK